LSASLSRGIGLDKFAPHEYTHLAQYGILNSKSQRVIGGIPTLFAEGSADFYGITFASEKGQASTNWSNYWSVGYMSSEVKAQLRQASVEQIEELLNDAMRYARLAPGHWYWTGAYATLRLIAANGHSGFVDFMRKHGELGNPYSAFETVYGMSFESFAKIIAPEVKALTVMLQR
jgi:hypothetical protein